MDVGLIVLYRGMNGRNVPVIDGDLVDSFHEWFPAYSTVTRSLRDERLHSSSEPSHRLAAFPQLTEMDQGILSALNAEQFAAVGDITRLTCLPYSTLQCPLRSHAFTDLPRPPSSLYPPFHDGWEKRNRVRDPEASPKNFQVQQSGSWFYCDTDHEHERIWLAPGVTSHLGALPWTSVPQKRSSKDIRLPSIMNTSGNPALSAGAHA
jgi:hypothetical protein